MTGITSGFGHPSNDLKGLEVHRKYHVLSCIVSAEGGGSLEMTSFF